MTYSELQDLCYEKRISMTSIAECADMTLRGFRTGMLNSTLQMKVVERVCRKLNITPNRFFNWDVDGAAYNTTQVGVMNNQNIGTVGLEMLQQQLATKDEQIKQLQQLLNKVLDNQ